MLAWVVLVLALLVAMGPTAHAGDSFNASGIDEWRFSAGYSTPSFIASGCTPAVPGSGLTLAAFACNAFVTMSTGQQEAIIQPSLAFTLPASGDGAYWLLIYRDTSSSVAGWSRSATTATRGSRYLAQKSSTRPAEINGGIIFARVDVLSGNIGNIAILGQRGGNPPSLVSLAEFGGAGDGIADSSYALQAAAATGRCIYIPEGTWYVPTMLTMTSGSLCLRGAGSSKTILKARASTTASSGALVVSYTVLRLSGMTSVDLRGFTVDGGIVTPGNYTIAGNYVDQMSVIEIRTSDNIVMDDVWITKAINTYTTTNQNPDIWLRFHDGVGLVYDSTNVRLLNSGIKNPSYSEGWRFIGVRGLVIDNFYSDAGEQSHATYGLATPINVIGRGATLYGANIKIVNTYITQNRGSAITLGCDKNVEIAHTYIDGLDGSNTVGKYRGINISDSVAADYDASHPSCDHINIHDNIILEAGDLAIQVGVGSGATTTTKHTHVNIHNNTIFHSSSGIVIGYSSYVNVENNHVRKTLDYGTAGYRGSGIYLVGVADAIVANNYIDGSEVNGANKLQFGLQAFTTLRIKVVDNFFRDAGSHNIFFPILTGQDNTYGDLYFENNHAVNLITIPTTPIQIGSSSILRLKSAWMADNSVNGVPWNDTTANKFIVSWTNDPVVLLGTITANFSVAAGGTPVLIVFNSAGYDTAAALNTGTGRVTVPRRGVYEFGCSGVFLSMDADKEALMWMYLNGSQSKRLDHRYSSATAGRSVIAGGNVQIQLQANDIVDCRAQHGSAGAINLNGSSTDTYMWLRFISDWP